MQPNINVQMAVQISLDKHKNKKLLRLPPPSAANLPLPKSPPIPFATSTSTYLTFGYKSKLIILRNSIPPTKSHNVETGPPYCSNPMLSSPSPDLLACPIGGNTFHHSPFSFLTVTHFPFKTVVPRCFCYYLIISFAG